MESPDKRPLKTLQEIHLRDPFVLKENGRYYLYGTRGAETWGAATGLDVYESDDLILWKGPMPAFLPPAGFWADRNFWAPEVHRYQGRYYMFASFKNETERRGTQILVADTPLGPFRLHSDGPVTPRDWECLDGTLYIDQKGDPYLVFCHEWLQVHDGEMCSIALSPDLRHAMGEPTVLFRASEPEWAPKDRRDYVTDGPWMYRNARGALLMLWSSFGAGGYVTAISSSDSGCLAGPWRHHKELLFSDNGGHAMLFSGPDEELMIALHSPNETPNERPLFLRVQETADTLRLAPSRNTGPDPLRQ